MAESENGTSFAELSRGEKVGLEAEISEVQDIEKLSELLKKHKGIAIEGSEHIIPVEAVASGIDDSYEQIKDALFAAITKGEELDINIDSILASNAVTRKFDIRHKARELIEKKIEKLYRDDIVRSRSFEELFTNIRNQTEIPRTSRLGSYSAEEVEELIDRINDFKKMYEKKKGGNIYNSRYSLGDITPSLGIKNTVLRLINEMPD